MTADDKPKIATPSADQRAAALRALEAESAADDGGHGGPADPTPGGGRGDGEGGGSRAVLIVGVVAVVAIVAVLAVVLLGGSDDDGEQTATEASTTTTSTEPESTTSTTQATTTTSTTEATTTSTTAAPATIPPPHGDPIPRLDTSTDDIALLAEQTVQYRRWLFANPDVAAAQFVTAPGSPAQAALVDQMTRLVDAGQVAIYEGYTHQVTDAHSHDDVANATWTESFTRYLVYDLATGQVVIELPGSTEAQVSVQWVRGSAGEWLLERFDGA